MAILLVLFVGSIVIGLLFGSWLGGGTVRPPQPAADPGSGQPAASLTLIASPSTPVTEAPTVTSSPATASQSATPAPSAVPSSSPSASGPITHVVERGESLTSIAALYGVSVKAIQDVNGIEDPNLIYVGQRLVIPGP